jgi:hypothetical protein
LQRSQIEREAQHQKTLEKHEKERADFEKRLAQEAEQQSKRIEQLQREWDRQRETLALNKARKTPGVPQESVAVSNPAPTKPASNQRPPLGAHTSEHSFNDVEFSMTGMNGILAPSSITRRSVSVASSMSDSPNAPLERKNTDPFESIGQQLVNASNDHASPFESQTERNTGSGVD